MNPVNLSLERRYFNLSVSIQSLPTFSNIFRGMRLCLKSFILSAVEWTSTNPSSMPVLLPPISKALPPTKANTFLRSQKIFVFAPNGLLQITARTFVWSPRESIGFLFTSFGNRPVTSFLLIPNAARRSRARRPTKRTRNGLWIFSCFGELCPFCEYSSVSGFGSLPLETDQFHCR